METTRKSTRLRSSSMAALGRMPTSIKILGAEELQTTLITSPLALQSRRLHMTRSVPAVTMWPAVHFAVIILAADSKNLPALQAAYQVRLAVLLHQRRAKSEFKTQ
ncbi:hypothetical protein EYF80_007653 [Liparis tanakae]|uniref:Uncharacterized protein n=1 Tax=Liparis tanakae TaxID=230148 RepID=A0A4Z2IW87_9TELE|nr:hypothetical protein EYF80_007653 [Liparis tanakae]